MVKRSIASIFIVVLVICQMCFVMPEEAFAEETKAGDTFAISVGYFGDDSEYRLKAMLSNADMRALPQQTNTYTNMTRIGTIMTTIGEGPTLEDVLNAAGIDVGSVRLIHMKTTDSTGKANNWFMEFPASKYIGSKLYYYPNIVDNWEVLGERLGKPLTGALKDSKEVDTIIAVVSHSTKIPSEAKELTKEDMTDEESYRLCAGQTALKENVETSAVSSNESAKWIYGMDITLWGSASDATDLSLNLDSKNIKVGSTKKIIATISGQELFEDKVNKNLKWSSSNNEIATVDENGNVTVKKKGKVTITAETANGIKKSIVINGKQGSGKGNVVANNTNSGAGNGSVDKKVKASGKTINAKEVILGDKVIEGLEEARPDMAEDAVALTKEKVDTKLMVGAGSVFLLIFSTGVIMRTKRYYKEV